MMIYGYLWYLKNQKTYIRPEIAQGPLDHIWHDFYCTVVDIRYVLVDDCQGHVPSFSTNQIPTMWGPPVMLVGL